MYSSVGQEIGDEGVRSVGFNYICGVLKSEDVEKFQKLVYRASRGNSFLKLLDIPLQKDEKGNWIHVQLNENGAPIPRTLFFLAFQAGGASQMLKNRLLRLADSFNARRYNLPKSADEIAEEVTKIDYDISSLIRIRDSTTEAINLLLAELVSRNKETGCSFFEELKIRVLREKCIYEHFDRMVLKDRIFYARIWVPEDQEGPVRRLVEEFGKAFNFNPP
jgi:V-type H+-transporting ATPase subunit a